MGAFLNLQTFKQLNIKTKNIPLKPLLLKNSLGYCFQCIYTSWCFMLQRISNECSYFYLDQL